MVALLAVTAAGCNTGDGAPKARDRATGTAGVEVRLPPGWHAIHGPVSAVIEPSQVVAAASVPLRLGQPQSQCSPDVLLQRLPPDQAAVEIVEWGKVTDVPRRPASFELRAGSYGNYECNGPSYNIPFRDHGRAFQAFVWLDPKRVDPVVRVQAIALLNTLAAAAHAK